jgi:hypothetical protein
MHGFPAALTSFIGRAGPVRELAGLLEEYRLVAMTGPGCSWKARLTTRVLAWYQLLLMLDNSEHVIVALAERALSYCRPAMMCGSWRRARSR